MFCSLVIIRFIMWILIVCIFLFGNDMITSDDEKVSTGIIVFISFFWFILIPLGIVYGIIQMFIYFFKGFKEFLDFCIIKLKKEKNKCSICQSTKKYNKYFMICKKCQKVYDIDSLEKVNDIIKIRENIKSKIF